MSIKKTLAGVVPFAHLLSRASAARAEEDDERKQREDESDEDYAKRMEELDEKEKAEQEKREKDEARARGEGNDVDGDDADADDENDDAKKAARASERARCTRIMAHGIALGSVRQAGVLAFNSRMSSREAIALLDAAKADTPAPQRNARRPALDERMAATQVPNPGAGGAAVTAPSLAEQIVLAGKKRRGEI